MTAGENADGKAGQAKPEGQKSLGLTWTGEIDLESGSGTIELAYTNVDLSACTASASATVEDYSETTCDQCAFQAGLRFDDFAIADESAAGCSNLVEMRGARIDIAHGTMLLINYAGVTYNQLLELSEDGMFTVSEKGFSALPNETTWLVGIKQGNSPLPLTRCCTRRTPVTPLSSPIVRLTGTGGYSSVGSFGFGRSNST